jgi:hypothetical protein
METRIKDVVVTRDGGQDCWDTTISAREIARAFTFGLLAIDPAHQRGKNTVTDKYMLKKDKVDRWARELQEDKAIFGQLTWNFRPESSDVSFEPNEVGDGQLGTLIIRDGTAYLPDSVHRHYAIKAAVESVSAGSAFDPARRFSLRIWKVPEAFENEIFYAMNMEHDKADATRSKWLSQKSSAQKIAAEVVRRSPHLGESNVETVTNNLSKNNPRLAAFNTISNGFEDAWDDIADEEIQAAVEWFIQYWSALVKVLPELGKLPLPKRQELRRAALTSSAISVQGYIRLARRFYNEKLGFELLSKLAEKHVDPDGTTYEYFAWNNPEWQRRGVVVSAVNKSGTITLTARNSHQSRRAMAEALASKVGLVDA